MEQQDKYQVQIKHLRTCLITYMLNIEKDFNIGEKQPPLHVALVYIAKEAFDTLKKTGEITVRTLNPYDKVWLRDQGPIKRESRLATIYFYPSGEVCLGLREGLARDKDLFAVLVDKSPSSIKLQTWETDEEISHEILQIKDIEAIRENKYLEFVGAFNACFDHTAKLWEKTIAEMNEKNALEAASGK